MVNYQNGKIYKLHSNQTNNVYIGSTTQTLQDRLMDHSNKYKRYQHKKTYFLSSFEILKYDDCAIALLETYPCNNKNELRNKEQEWIDKTLDTINKNNAVSKCKYKDKPVEYKNGKIYKLVSCENEKCYIGSTAVVNLDKRLKQHFNAYTKYKKNNGSYLTSFEIMKYEDCKIILLEEYPCDTEDELKQREGQWIKCENCVNKMISGRNKKEYYQDRKKYLKTYYKKYEMRTKKYQKKYRETNKDDIVDYKKQYYIKNKVKISEEKKQKYQENKNQIRVDQKKKMKCECGSIISKSSYYSHMKSTYHNKIVNVKN